MIARTDDVRTQNRKRVLALVRLHRAISRTEIGTYSGLSAATVSTITTDLIDEGVLRPVQHEPLPGSGRGRPPVTLQLEPKAALICAVHFRFNQIEARIVDYAGEIHGEHIREISTQDMGATDIKNTLFSCIDDALKVSQRNHRALIRISVGFQGVTDVEGSMVLWTPICPEQNIPIKAWLEHDLGVSAVVANDCNLLAEALSWQSPDKYGENFGAILIAEGVGMGLCLGGETANGTISSGFEFGHMGYIPDGSLCRCGNLGCIEAYAGSYAIHRRALGKDLHSPPQDLVESPNLEAIARAAEQGDRDALAAIESAGAAIGTGIAGLFALMDRFPIVLVGSGTIFFQYMEKAMLRAIRNAPTISDSDEIDIDCFSKEAPLVLDGCVIRALKGCDDMISEQRLGNEVAS
ncbi:MAG: ROK family transcriptional regulator [Gammaproteobacteria bacterium]|nr:ROK family transcriptional regulator [Gammaproteobacteria bacterium]